MEGWVEVLLGALIAAWLLLGVFAWLKSGRPPLVEERCDWCRAKRPVHNPPPASPSLTGAPAIPHLGDDPMTWVCVYCGRVNPPSGGG